MSYYCKTCKRPILWQQTKARKMMPVDPDPVTVITPAGDVVTGYISHFATCPDADHFRRRKPTTPKGAIH